MAQQPASMMFPAMSQSAMPGPVFMPPYYGSSSNLNAAPPPSLWSTYGTLITLIVLIIVGLLLFLMHSGVRLSSAFGGHGYGGGGGWVDPRVAQLADGPVRDEALEICELIVSAKNPNVRAQLQANLDTLLAPPPSSHVGDRADGFD